MRGRHKHKWDFLREVLSERIVYDDVLHRAWFGDEAQGQGLLYTCKQGQINMDKPLGRFKQGNAYCVGPLASRQLHSISPHFPQASCTGLYSLMGKPSFRLWRCRTGRAGRTPS